MDSTPFFPNKYLSKDDFMGREADLTVCEVAIEELFTQGGKQKKIVVYYKETREKAARDGWPQNEKRIVLGKTLWGDYCSLFGSKDTAAWVGKRATHYVGPAIGGGKNCVRAKASAATSTGTETNTTDTEKKES